MRVVLNAFDIGVRRVWNKKGYQLIQLRTMEDVGKTYKLLGGNSGLITGHKAELIGTNFLKIIL